MNEATEKALDEIFGGPPGDFIAGRDALVKGLRADGNEDDAREVKALRKPSKAAWVVNALALDDPEPIKRYLELADELRKVTSGKIDATRMRELAREEGELLEELVARAETLAGESSSATLDRVRETLQAAQVDPELAAKVLAGRVEREERAASVGLENLAAPPQASPRTSAKPKEAGTGAKAKEKDANRKRLAEAKEALKEAKAEARKAAREVARAAGELAKAERAREAADGKVERAEKKLQDLG